VLSINLLRDGDRSKGVAFIKFSSEESMKNAIEASGISHMNRQIVIQQVIPR